MTDPLDDVLRLVAEGRLSPEEAASVIDALQMAETIQDEFDADGPGRRTSPAGTNPGPGSGAPGGRPRVMLLEIQEDGRKVVNLRVPLSLGQMGLDRIPGLSTDNVSRIRQALDEGLTGAILSVDEDADGNGVRIVLE